MLCSREQQRTARSQSSLIFPSSSIHFFLFFLHFPIDQIRLTQLMREREREVFLCRFYIFFLSRFEYQIKIRKRFSYSLSR